MKNKSKKCSTYWKVGFITLVLLLTTGSALVAGQNRDGNDYITKIFTFTTPQIHQIVINNQLYDEVIMSDAQGAWNVGEPNLPAYGVSLLLPQGTIAVDITIQPGTKIQLGSGFTVAPVEQPVTLSEFTTVSAKGTTNQTIYSSDNVFPSTLFSIVGTYCFRGYNLLILQLYPVQYQPISGQLSYFDEVTVVVKTIQTGLVNPLYRSLEKDSIDVAKKVDSLDSLSSYRCTPFAPLTAAGYDLGLKLKLKHLLISLLFQDM